MFLHSFGLHFANHLATGQRLVNVVSLTWRCTGHERDVCIVHEVCICSISPICGHGRIFQQTVIPVSMLACCCHRNVWRTPNSLSLPVRELQMGRVTSVV